MMKSLIKGVVRCFGWITGLALIAFYFTPQMQQLRSMPNVLHIRSEDTFSAASVLEGTDRLLTGGRAVSVSQSSDQRLDEVASTSLTYRLFGVIPLKSVQVLRSEDIYLTPGGTAVGITIRTKGVLVVGLGTVDTRDGALSPGSAAGLRAGDVLLTANGKSILNADNLAKIVQASDGLVALTFDRDGQKMETSIRLVRAASDDALRIGLWVRDSTAGVGTLSFVDANTNWFAALGHPVSDIDTQSMLPLREGRVVSTEIVSVRPGEQGNPGELIGVFSTAGPSLGQIKANTQYGIYGQMDVDYKNPLSDEILMGYGYEAHVGPAKILATISKDGVEAFDCEVIRVNPQSDAATKGLVITITDEKLLQKTGGIVQGMSGCPVIQDGKLIAVVTHVFVNDPTRGYCVYAEWMRQILMDQAG